MNKYIAVIWLFSCYSSVFEVCILSCESHSLLAYKNSKTLESLPELSSHNSSL